MNLLVEFVAVFVVVATVIAANTTAAVVVVDAVRRHVLSMMTSAPLFSERPL